MSTLHDQLTDLAGDAPAGGPVPGLWEQGVRRRRRRQAARLGAVAAAVVLVSTLVTVLQPGAAEEPEPVQVPFDELHLPRTVYPPDPWADGTKETGAPGPLAVVSTAWRNRAEGLLGVRRVVSPFGVSAVDGSTVFLDLEGDPDGLISGTTLAVSPDGTKVGYVRTGEHGGEIAGFAVYDAVTGATVLLDDPAHDAVRLWSDELSFSGDSRYLQTSYAPGGSAGNRSHSLVVWDVVTGEPAVAEQPGRYWLPSMGQGPSGIVWSRGSRTFTFDPATSQRTSIDTDFEVVQASYGPDGEAFAAIAFGPSDQADWRLFVGGRPDDLRRATLPIDADRFLGWRDAHRVVVGQLPERQAVEVDVRTGRSAPLQLTSVGEEVDLPSYAADLWANPLVDGVRPPEHGDPRRPWQLGGIGLMVAAAALLWRRRVRA